MATPEYIKWVVDEGTFLWGEAVGYVVDLEQKDGKIVPFKINDSNFRNKTIQVICFACDGPDFEGGITLRTLRRMDNLNPVVLAQEIAKFHAQKHHTGTKPLIVCLFSQPK